MKDCYNEILKLKNLMEKHNIPYHEEEHMNGLALSYPDMVNCVCSIIQHDWSYGHEDNLLEIMGLPKEDEAGYDCMVGRLTAEDVFARIYNHYKENNNGDGKDE